MKLVKKNSARKKNKKKSRLLSETNGYRDSWFISFEEACTLWDAHPEWYGQIMELSAEFQKEREAKAK